MPTRVSLRMVADTARVSTATASLALSGSPRVAAETRYLVMAAAQHLGYVRNLAFSCIASGHFRHAGRPPVVATWMDHGIHDEHFRQQAKTLGMDVRTLPDVPGDLTAELRHISASALVVCRRASDVATLARLPVHTVLWLDEGRSSPELDVIETHEWWSATVDTVQRVIAAGYQRPAVIAIPAEPRHWHDDVRAGAARALGLPFLEWNGDAPSIRAFIRRHRPDALIGGVAAVASRLRELGIERPFAALIITGSAWHRDITGWITDQESRELATLELIEWRLRHGPRPPRRIIILPHWQEGKSLPARVL
jgi:DNA-binding LacI/PurR family transcriptional regulator